MKGVKLGRIIEKSRPGARNVLLIGGGAGGEGIGLGDGLAAVGGTRLIWRSGLARVKPAKNKNKAK